MKPNLPGIVFYLQDSGMTGSNVVIARYLAEISKSGSFRFAFVVQRKGVAHELFLKWGNVFVMNEKKEKKTVRQRIADKLVVKKQDRFEEVHHFIDSFDPALIYCNTILAVRDLDKIFSKSEIPLIVHVHELKMISRHLNIQVAPVDGRITWYIANSRATAEFLKSEFNISSSKIVTHFPPVPEPSKFPATKAFTKKKDTILIGSSGSGIGRKGVFLFIELALLLSRNKNGRHFSFMWVGNISMNRAEILHDVEKAGVSDLINFTGEVVNPLDYYSEFDAFVSLSKEESFGLACAEAASLGIPIFGFKGTGGSEELIAETSGLLVDYLDLYAMADLITKKSLDPEKLRECGKSQTGKIEKYYSENVIPKWVNFVSTLVLKKIPE